MEFSFYKNEIEEVKNLIKNSFDIDVKDSILLNNNQRILLLKENNKVIGLTLITLKNDPIKMIKYFFLDYVCVDKDYRNKGYGTRMFNEIERIAKEEKIDIIELTSNIKRKEARSIYIKNGMEIVDTDIFRKNIQR